MRKIVAALSAAIAAAFAFGVVVPNLTDAMNRSRQNRAMSDLRTIALALEARATTTKSYTIGAADPKSGTSVEQFEKLHRVSFADLERALVPSYIKALPRQDGWENDYDVRIGKYNDKGEASLYAIRSYGSDGRADSGPYTSRTITEVSQDLVYSDGTFIQYPEGV